MGAKSLCIPFEQPTGEDAIVPGKTKCPQCGEDAVVSFMLYLIHIRGTDSTGIALHVVRTFILDCWLLIGFLRYLTGVEAAFPLLLLLMWFGWDR
jgi:prolyl-tRNA synthetase